MQRTWSTVGFTGDNQNYPGCRFGGIGMTVFGMSVIDKVGRPLLLWGAIECLCSWLLLPRRHSGTLTPEGNQPPMAWAYFALIAAHMVYIVFCGTWGVVLWVFLGEVFRTKSVPLV